MDDAKKQAFKERMAKARAEKKLAKAKEPVVAKELPPVKLDFEIKWFTEVDYNDKGKLANDLPAYYFDEQIRELAEDIRVVEENLELGVYTGTRKRDAMKQLEDKKRRYSKVVDGKPKLSGVNKDKVYRSLKEFGQKITESMYSESDMWTQKADPHREAERMVNPCIKITDEIVGSFVKEKGMNVVDGKISRNDASLAYKTLAKVLGESTNIEDLRPPNR
jgi:hypothetical protein